MDRLHQNYISPTLRGQQELVETEFAPGTSQCLRNNTALFELGGQGNTKVSLNIQEVFHVYLKKFEIALSHLFLIIFSNNKFTLVNPFSRNG